MGIEEKINADVKASMLAKDAKRLEAVRAIKSVILYLKDLQAFQKKHLW